MKTEKSYKKELLIGIPEGTLIDIETTGINPEHSEIITLGYIKENGLYITQRRSKKEKPFYTDIQKIISALPEPFYAYNLGFEVKFIRYHLDIEVRGIDIFEPWKRKAKSEGKKWPKLDELITEPEEYFGEERISGSDIPSIWKDYLESGNEHLLDLIIRHNQSDLLRELFLLTHYPFFK